MALKITTKTEQNKTKTNQKLPTNKKFTNQHLSQPIQESYTGDINEPLKVACPLVWFLT